MPSPSPKQLLDGIVDLFTPKIKAAFLAAIDDVTNNALITEIVNAIQSGDIDAAFRALGFSDAAMRPIDAMIEQAYETGGIFTGNTFPKYINTPSGKAVFRFDVRNSRAEAWLRDNSSTLITNITDDARVNVRTLVQQGMKNGANPRSVALDIIGRIDPVTGNRVGGVVGLTPGQEGWVQSAKQKLATLDSSYFDMGLRDKRFDSTVSNAIKNNTPLSDDVISKLVGRYRDNALKYRGEVIGRTEAMQALNAAEYEATKQAVKLGAISSSAVQREWDSAGDNRVRWSHKALNRKRVGLDQPFVSPSGARMMHPGDTSLGAPGAEVIMCRCRVRSVIDWLSDLN